MSSARTCVCSAQGAECFQIGAIAFSGTHFCFMSDFIELRRLTLALIVKFIFLSTSSSSTALGSIFSYKAFTLWRWFSTKTYKKTNNSPNKSRRKIPRKIKRQRNNDSSTVPTSTSKCSLEAIVRKRSNNFLHLVGGATAKPASAHMPHQPCFSTTWVEKHTGSDALKDTKHFTKAFAGLRETHGVAWADAGVQVTWRKWRQRLPVVSGTQAIQPRMAVGAHWKWGVPSGEKGY